MPRVRPVLLVGFALATIGLAPLVVAKKDGTATGTSSLVAGRQRVSDDPLDGIPDESGGRGAKGASRAARTCRLDVRAERKDDVGDLRAVLAFMQLAPKTQACAAGALTVTMSLSIDEAGRVIAVERVGGDEKLGAGLAKHLAGKTANSSIRRTTAGRVAITLQRAR